MLGRGYVALGILLSTPLPAAEKPGVEFQRQKGSLVITIGGKPLATYVPGDHNTRRPYFKHLHAPGGIQVSRNHPPREGDRQDHAALHPGLCLAFGDVSGNDYWRNRARVAHEGYEEKPSGGSGRGSFAVRNRYLGKDGRTVCVETCRFTFLVRPAGYLLIWDSRFKSDSADFYFGDQEEMGLAIRVHTPMNVSGGNGRILNSNGRRNEKGAWGKTADWCDYGGPVDGKYVGVTLMPDPANFRPSWFHARDYGVLVANPFGRKAFTRKEPSKVVVKKGETFRLAFGVLLYAGDSESSIDLKEAYAGFLEVVADQQAAGARGGQR